jgi:5-methylcytosine-specific restriction endonuclease McrA
MTGVEVVLGILAAMALVSRRKKRRRRPVLRAPTRPPRGPRYATPRQRAIVLRRDRYRCRRCGARRNLQIDHVVPWSWGGPTTVGNLQVLCKRCNMRKGARYQG